MFCLDEGTGIYRRGEKVKPKDTSKKVALVTGGGRGIGREIARFFGKKGYRIAICGRHEHVLLATKDDFERDGVQTIAIRCDVTDRSQCQAAVDAVVAEFGRIDVLVNNAGMTMRGRFDSIDLELFHKINDVNFSGAVNMTRLALGELKKSGGSVSFISSLAGLKGLPAVAPYCTAKMALTALGESLRMELSPAVHVGVLYVSFTANDEDKMMYNEKGELIPLKREKTANSQEDVARACFRLVSRRKRRIVMTLPGKILHLFYRLFPDLAETIIARFAGGSSLYAYDERNGQ